MKIAYCTPSLYIPGGVERVLTTHVNWLVEHTAHEVYILITDGKGKDPYYALDSRVNVVQLDVDFEVLWSLNIVKKGLVYMRKQREYKRKLTEALFRLRPDVTVTLMRREVNFLTDIHDGSKKLGWLHVTRSHYRNFEANETSAFKRMLEKYWMWQLVRKVKRLDQFVVLTQEDANSWKEVENVTAIPNPLPEVYSKRSTLQAKQAMACGRYVYSKGYDMLLEAWALVNKRHPDWKLAIYGKGEHDDLQQLAESLLITDSVQLHGATNDVESCYAASSIFAMSSRFEGFGMVLIEAMSCGVPCVSFACPCGPGSIIHDKIDGILAAPEDVCSLAEGLCYLIEHEDERIRMGEKAYHRSQDFKVDTVMEMWVALFNNVIKKK